MLLYWRNSEGVSLGNGLSSAIVGAEAAPGCCAAVDAIVVVIWEMCLLVDVDTAGDRVDARK